MSAAGARVFAVGVDDVQLTWRSLPAGRLTITGAGTELVVAHPGGPGATTVAGLAPGAAFELQLRCERRPGWSVALRGETLRAPPGSERFRIATISDLHVGETAFGYLRTIAERGAAEPYPLRCTRAAITELAAWGAQLLVVKGDAADQSWPELWEQTAALLASSPAPVVLLPGNHERKTRRTVEPRTALAHTGLAVVERGLAVRDVPALRLLLADTTTHGRDIGSVAAFRGEVLDAAANAAGGVLLLTHHHLARRPFFTELPYGIPKRESDSFLAALARANPATLVSCGHTHRHRRHRVGPVTVTTVGSVKDFPGVWAGYTVYDGGIVQTVRRVADRSVLRWTDQSSRAIGGLYRSWTPGRLRDRCFSLSW